MSKPKTTLVGDVTVGDVLDELTTNEPATTGPIEVAAGPEATAPVDVQILGADTLPAAGGPVDSLQTGAGGATGPSPREAAENTVELVLTAIGDSCAGEWQPDDENEREGLVAALEHVLERRPLLLAAAGKIPPEMVLAAVVHRYARKRVTRPTTAQRLRAWAAGKMPRWLKRPLGVTVVDQGTRGQGDRETETTPAAPALADPYEGRA